MAEPLFSTSWYRVKDLTPRLRSHAAIHRHRYRGETWYVLQDSANDRFHRFTPAVHYVIGIMDGCRSVDELWRRAAEELGDDAPTQDEMIRLLGQLHAADVLQCDVPPDAAELLERGEKYESRQLRSRLMSPFAIRVPLVDPERFLAATVELVRPLFGWGGALLWLSVVLPAVVLAGVHWSELTGGILDRLFTPGNLFAVWLIFPIMKAMHELGHGYAAKAFGGQVHDMGVMFLVFTPVPYVDASSAWAFRSKLQRALVGAGGMIVEAFLAALAFYVWLAAEPGAVRAIAYNALIIGGVTTLLFNANPLLRFDGYYILSDLIEIPNLRVRGNQYLGYLCERYLLGKREVEAPPMAPGESAWFVFYTVAAFLYRIAIVIAIFTWILDQFFAVGLLLGIFASIGWVGVPLFKGLKYLFASPRLRRERGRALAVCGAAVALVSAGLALIPVPLRTQAEGVVWIPEEAFVRAGAEGFVERVAAAAGSVVQAGDLLIELRDPEVEAEVEALQARVRELEARYTAERTDDLVTAQLTGEELVYARRNWMRARERADEFQIRSSASGSFVISRPQDLSGRFVNKGQLLGHVVDLATISVRAVVSQEDVQLIGRRLARVDVRLAERLSETYGAELQRIVPAASDALPSPVLGAGGGGEVPIDPRAPGGDKAMQSMFELELELPVDVPLVNAGGRVYLRFDLGSEALAMQWYRRVRQIFLSRFHV